MKKLLGQLNEIVNVGWVFSSDCMYIADIEKKVSTGNGVNKSLGKLRG